MKLDFLLILNLFYLRVIIISFFNLLNVLFFYEKPFLRDTVTHMINFIVLSLAKTKHNKTKQTSNTKPKKTKQKSPGILNLVLELITKHTQKSRSRWAHTIVICPETCHLPATSFVSSAMN